jgi:hypothetical protein
MKPAIHAPLRKEGQIWKELFFTLYLYGYILMVGMAGLKSEA